MYRFACILTVLLAVSTGTSADDYVDDLYYSDETAAEQQIQSGDLKPMYNKAKMEPFYFADPIEEMPQDSIPTTADSTAVRQSTLGVLKEV